MQRIEEKTKQSIHFDVVPITTEDDKYQLMERAHPFHEQLKLTKGRNYKELYRNLEIGGEAVFAVLDGPEPKDIALVEGRLKTVILGEGKEYQVYMRFLRAVADGYQQQGVGTLLTNEVVERLNPDAISGRTPNPYVFGADKKSPYVGTIYPIDKLFTPKAEMLLLGTLDEEQRREVNPKTGRCKVVYPPGAFRLFCIENASPLSRWILERMTGSEIKADLEAGDGIRYLEMVIKNLQEQSLKTP